MPVIVTGFEYAIDTNTLSSAIETSRRAGCMIGTLVMQELCKTVAGAYRQLGKSQTIYVT